MVTHLKSIFHVGHRKCASTFLQDVVFAKHPNIHLLDRRGLPRYVAVEPETDYDARFAAEQFHHERTLCEQAGKSIVMVSEERILTLTGIDSGMIAKRLFALDGEAMVLVVIRNQADFLLSNHSQSVATGKTKLFLFDAWIEAIKISGDRNSYLYKADHYNQIRAFDSLFGRFRVGVFLLEDMRSDPSGFAARLGDFLGINLSGPAYDPAQSDCFDPKLGKRPRMARSSRWAILARSSPTIRAVDGLLRPITFPFIRHAVGRVTGLAAPHNKSASPETQRWIAERYRESNHRLAERLGRDLGPLGYPM